MLLYSELASAHARKCLGLSFPYLSIEGIETLELQRAEPAAVRRWCEKWQLRHSFEVGIPVVDYREPPSPTLMVGWFGWFRELSIMKSKKL